MTNQNFSIETIFSKTRNKKELFALATHLNFGKLLLYGLQKGNKSSWKAAWLVAHLMQKNDAKIIVHLEKIIAAIPQKEDGHQRQLLIIIASMELNEEQEGRLFQYGVSLWTNIHKIPSTRITAFQLLCKIAKNHPDLVTEIILYTGEYYTETLSPGIKKNFQRLKKSLAIQESKF
jgi:hypothetical protein